MKAFGLTEELPGDPKHWNLVLWRISLPLEPDDGSGHGQVLLKLLYHLSAEATCADRVVRQLHLEQSRCIRMIRASDLSSGTPSIGKGWGEKGVMGELTSLAKQTYLQLGFFESKQ